MTLYEIPEDIAEYELRDIEKYRQDAEKAIRETREEVIEHIASNEGWEETGDIYRKYYGLKKKYGRAKG